MEEGGALEFADAISPFNFSELSNLPFILEGPFLVKLLNEIHISVTYIEKLMKNTYKTCKSTVKKSIFVRVNAHGDGLL